MFRNIKKVLMIACVSMAVGVASIPSIVAAQTSTQNSTQSQTNTRKPRQENSLKQLNLSAEQKAQIKTIRESARTRSQNIFTDEQRATMKQNREARKSGGVKQDKKRLNLTADQKEGLKAIAKDTKAKVRSVLTSEQQQQFDTIQQQRKENRKMTR